jgi:hypothetical protein
MTLTSLELTSLRVRVGQYNSAPRTFCRKSWPLGKLVQAAPGGASGGTQRGRARRGPLGALKGRSLAVASLRPSLQAAGGSANPVTVLRPHPKSSDLNEQSSEMNGFRHTQRSFAVHFEKQPHSVFCMPCKTYLYVREIRFS